MPFGGAIKLTGESEYKKALSSINQSLKEVGSEMKVVSSAYDKNDKSTEALNAKSQALNKTYDAQNQKLNVLKAQYSAMASQYADQSTKHQTLVNSYNKEKAELERIGQTLGTTSKEYQDQKAKVEALGQEVDKSTKAQDANEKSMSQMRIQINQAQADCNNTAKAIDELGNETEDSGKQAEKASSGGFTVMKQVLANLATDAIRAAADGLKKLGAAFIDIGKNALQNYSEFEQLAGGVETLFSPPESMDEFIARMGEAGIAAEDAAQMYSGGVDLVMRNANDAYKTAGLSANEYMATATSFSASLLQGLNGDTVKAAQLTDKAITDMSDNANKMGTSMESLQAAYQGFAKGNFTLLDNLKLGYGGTKTEMLRLVKDAGVVDESVKSLDDVSFDQMIEAIHIVQENMGITGTTAKEASTTIQGSTSAMKSAWQNMLTGIADDNADFDQLIGNLVESITTVASNLVPRIQTIIEGIGTAIPQLITTLMPEVISLLTTVSESLLQSIPDVLTSLANGVMEALPVIMPVLVEVAGQLISMITEMVPSILTGIVDAFIEGFPTIVTMGVDMILNLADGIVQAIPDLVAKIPEVISSVLTTITSLLPKIVSEGASMLGSLITGLLGAIPQLVGALPEIIETTVTTLTDMLPDIIETGDELLVSLINGILEAIPQLISMLPTIIETTVRVLSNNLPKIIQAGITILTNLINGILNALPQLVAMVPQLISTIVTTLANGLPQILQMGGRIISQLGEGITNSIGTLLATCNSLVSRAVSAIGNVVGYMAGIGRNLVQGIWNGISSAVDWVLSKIRGFGSSIVSGIKRIFGIASPSKLMRDEVGKNLALGIGEGFSDEMGEVTAEMQSALPTSFDTAVNVSSGDTGNPYTNMVSAFKEALREVKVELDDREVGTFIDKTVTELVYA